MLRILPSKRCSPGLSGSTSLFQLICPSLGGGGGGRSLLERWRLVTLNLHLINSVNTRISYQDVTNILIRYPDRK
ncbi:hypothetical protein Hanom_Chr04g00294851 [Helianthus anomalus]